MSKVLRYLPEIEGDEQLYPAQLITDMTDEQAEQFARIYRERRRDPTHILLLALVGFLGAAALNGFYTNYRDFVFEAQTGEVLDGLPVFAFGASDAYGLALLYVMEHQ